MECYGPGAVELAQETLQANREHLDALKTYTHKLQTELETLDKLVEAVNATEESVLDVGSFVTIPGSVRATAPITAKELLSPEFPFHGDTLKRSRYQSFTHVHPMKPKELEALAEAVRSEGHRRNALDIQTRGRSPFPNIDAQTTHIPELDVEGLDWSRIAEKVSALSVTRTARECEIRWRGEQHPEFNHGPWSKGEVLKVKSVAAEFTDSQPDWVEVAKRLGTKRTPLDCMRHATSRKSHLWTTEADERLLKAIRMYGHDNWSLVAHYVSEDATPSQCSTRFEKTLNQSIKHTSWSPEEDARLSAAVAAYGSSWVDVAANIPGRHNDQCRDRWTEQVNPNINKNRWTEEEDRILLDHVRQHENASWKEVSERLSNGRTETMCRSRYATLRKSAKATSHEEIPSVDQAPAPSEFASLTSNAFTFKSAFPKVYPCSTTPAPSRTENYPLDDIVFLEPVVSSNPESHGHHGSQTDILPSNTMSSLKKRKTCSRAARSKRATKEAQLEESTS